MDPGKREQMEEALGRKESMLHKLYEVYAHWVSRYPLACQKGCSACCTQSVTMTSLEGEEIVGFFRKQGEEKKLSGLLAEIPFAASGTLMTTNKFARLCLEQREIDDNSHDTWNFEPCIFLTDDVCTIYEVRPFGCRSFGSQRKCAAGSPAEVAPLHVTVNTVFTQIIEHLSSDGGYWGNMADILKVQTGQSAGKQIAEARSLPGFLIEPSEKEPVHRLLSKLFTAPVGAKSFAELIDNFKMME
jgi:Fe-S-cluster containining protein